MSRQEQKEPRTQCIVCKRHYDTISEGTLIHNVERGIPHTACTRCVKKLVREGKPCPVCGKDIILPTEQEEKQYLNDLARLYNKDYTFFSKGELHRLKKEFEDFDVRYPDIHPNHHDIHYNKVFGTWATNRYIKRPLFDNRPDYSQANFIPVNPKDVQAINKGSTGINTARERERLYELQLERIRRTGKKSICSKLGGCTVQ